MIKVSKKLRNAIIVEGQKDQILKLMCKMGEFVNINHVRAPKSIDKLDASFIDNNWVMKRFEGNVAHIKISSNNYFAFAEDEETEQKISNLIKYFRVKCKFSKFREIDEHQGEIITDFYDFDENGKEKITTTIELVKTSNYYLPIMFREKKAKIK